MSRIAKKPLEIPKGVECSIRDSQIYVKGKNGEFTLPINEAVNVDIDNNVVSISAKKDKHPMVGTTRILLGNMFQGASVGFEKKLKLVGVGYKAKVNGNILELELGYSHPVTCNAPEGISFEVPTPTDIIVKGKNKQAVGEMAAKIRSKRKPEVYKGKGIRYANEVIIQKEVKKK